MLADLCLFSPKDIPFWYDKYKPLFFHTISTLNFSPRSAWLIQTKCSLTSENDTPIYPSGFKTAFSYCYWSLFYFSYWEWWRSEEGSRVLSCLPNSVPWHTVEAIQSYSYLAPVLSQIKIGCFWKRWGTLISTVLTLCNLFHFLVACKSLFSNSPLSTSAFCLRFQTAVFSLQVCSK